MYEGLLLGLAIGGLFWLAMWSGGARPRLTPSRESLAFVALGIAFWFVLRQPGALDPSTSVFVGFVAAAIVLGLWRRFAHHTT